MKDSGVEWIGEIPKEWEVIKMKHLGQFSSSGIDKKIVEGEPLVRIINYTDVYGNKSMVLDNKKDYMIVSTSKDKVKKHTVKEGDLIFTPSSETIEDIGISALVYEELENTAFSYHVLRFQFNRHIDKEYKKYLCNNWYALNVFSSKATGTTRKILNRDDFKDLKVLLPNLQEQQAIANYLDSKVSQIDDIIEKTKQSIEDYKKYKQSLITETVTKGLNPDVEMKDSGIEWIGEVPKHWEVFRLRYLFRFNNGLTITRSDLKESGVSCINYGDIHSKYTFDLDLKRDSLPKVDEDFKLTRPNALLNNGDFVFCDTSEDLDGSGNFVFIRDTDGKEIFAGSHTTIAKPKINLNSAYVGYLLKSFGVKRQFEREVVGVKVYSITQDVLKNIELVLPPLDEQEEIARYLDYKRIQVDEIISKKKCLIKDLETYKKSLIYECVTGKRNVGA
jgi:type I restriction enzyme S subunit